MTRFDNPPHGALESRSRALLSHVEAASEREGLEYPAEAQALATILKRLDEARTPSPAQPF
jgi:hypothetical protein